MEANMLIKSIIVLIAVISVIYILYINGLIIFSNKKALMFISKNSLSKKCISATFKACTGFVKKVLPLKENREYTFNLECNVDNGEIKVIIKNSDKKTILSLTPENPTETIYLNSGKYYISIELYKAYGKYSFSYK